MLEPFPPTLSSARRWLQGGRCNTSFQKRGRLRPTQVRLGDSPSLRAPTGEGLRSQRTDPQPGKQGSPLSSALAAPDPLSGHGLWVEGGDVWPCRELAGRPGPSKARVGAVPPFLQPLLPRRWAAPEPWARVRPMSVLGLLTHVTRPQGGSLWGTDGWAHQAGDTEPAALPSHPRPAAGSVSCGDTSAVKNWLRCG